MVLNYSSLSQFIRIKHSNQGSRESLLCLDHKVLLTTSMSEPHSDGNPLKDYDAKLQVLSLTDIPVMFLSWV